MNYIAILRGINVGGRRRILMVDLKNLFKNLGFEDITTYIQSGNVLFKCNNCKENNIRLGDKIEQAILKKYGFNVPVIVRTKDEIQKAVTANPFAEGYDEDLQRLHLTFLKDKPAINQLEEIEEYDHSPDRFKIIDLSAFIYCSGKYSDTKLTNKFFEKSLKVSATTRNWKTVLKLMELSV